MTISLNTRKHWLFMAAFHLIAGCNSSPKDVWRLDNGQGCSLWWLYDQGISDGPTPYVVCFNQQTYRTYSISRYGDLRKRLISDVAYPVIEHGQWSLRHDSLWLQGRSFSTFAVHADTVYLRPDAFLIDVTNKFNIENCDCDHLTAQFKGGAIDSLKTLLHYQE